MAKGFDQAANPGTTRKQGRPEHTALRQFDPIAKRFKTGTPSKNSEIKTLLPVIGQSPPIRSSSCNSKDK